MYREKISTVADKIKELEKEKAALEERQNVEETKSPERQIANLMHSLLCNCHGDCGYGVYPKIDYDPDSASSWLSQAKRYIDGLERTESGKYRSGFELAKDALHTLVTAQKTPWKGK